METYASFVLPQGSGWLGVRFSRRRVSSLHQSASVTSPYDWVLSPHHNHSCLRVSHFWPFNQWFCSCCVSKLSAQRSRNNRCFRGDDGVSKLSPSPSSLSPCLMHSHCLWLSLSSLWPKCLFLHVLWRDPYRWPWLYIPSGRREEGMMWKHYKKGDEKREWINREKKKKERAGRWN